MYTYHSLLRAQLQDARQLPLSIRRQPAFRQLIGQLLQIADLLLYVERATQNTNTLGTLAVLDTVQLQASSRLRSTFTSLDGLIAAHELGLLAEEWDDPTAQAWLHDTRRVIALAAYGVIHHPQALPIVVGWLDHVWESEH